MKVLPQTGSSMWNDTEDILKEIYGWEKSFKVRRDAFASVRSTINLIL